MRGVTWGISWRPDLSSPFLPPSLSSAHCLLHLRGERLVAGLVGVVPPGRIHTAASLKSLSRRLVSSPLGSLPRVADREMGEVAETGEMFCEQLNSHMWLTVLHCDAESPLPAQHTVWLSHLSAAVCWASLFRNKTKTPRNS